MHHLVLIVVAAALLGQMENTKAAVTTNSRTAKNVLELHSNGGNSIFTNNDGKPKSSGTGVRHFLNITQRPPTVVYLGDDPGNLTCEAVGAPAPNIMWYKNDMPITGHNVDSSAHQSPSNTSIASVTSTLHVTRHAGRHASASRRDVYTCRARSGKLAAMSQTVVEYLDTSTEPSERHKLVPFEPSIVFSYVMYLDTIGNSMILPCKVKGHPRPLVKWTDNNGAPVTSSENMKVLRNGSLYVKYLRWSHLGEWTCRIAIPTTAKSGTTSGTTAKSGTDNARVVHEATTFVYPILAG